MRVLQVTDSYAPAPGGLEKVVERLAHDLAARGHDSAVATLAREGQPDHEWTGDVEIHRLRGWTHRLARFATDDVHLLHPTAPDRPLVRALQDLVDRWRPDIVHVHGWILSSCTSLRLAPAARLVTSLHDYGLVCAKKTLIHLDDLDRPCSGPGPVRCVRCSSDFYGVAKGVALATGLREGRRRTRRVDAFLPITGAVADACAAVADPARSMVVPPFVADAVVQRVDRPRPAGLPAGEFLLFVGALSEHKGVGLLLDAHRAMRHRVPLVLVGARDPGRWTSALAGADVRVLQGLPYEQILGAQQQATVAVVPSRWAEPFGLVAIEAMAAGTPVVATDVGSLAEIVGDAGLVVPTDVTALAGALDRLFDDPGLRDALGAAGPARARDYAAAQVVPRYEQAYTRVLGAPSLR